LRAGRAFVNAIVRGMQRCILLRPRHHKTIVTPDPCFLCVVVRGFERRELERVELVVGRPIVSADRATWMLTKAGCTEPLYPVTPYGEQLNATRECIRPLGAEPPRTAAGGVVTGRKRRNERHLVDDLPRRSPVANVRTDERDVVETNF